jgi:hypothetical protein
MKKIFILILLSASSGFAMSQSGNSLVTNLQLKAGTIRTIAPVARGLNERYSINAFIKWYNQIKAVNPSDNANVTVDSIPTLMVARIYEISLFDVKYDDVRSDISSALTSKRATNTLLDALCTAAEAALTRVKTEEKNKGTDLLKN